MTADVAGVLPVVHTPFDSQGAIDYETLGREVEWALGQGADGVTTGMVSELLRLSTHERMELTRQLVPTVNGRGIVVASVGAECTQQAVQFAEHAERAGCNALMAIPPTTTALPDDELKLYFQLIATAVELPLIVQDASGYVGRAIPLTVCVELLDQFGPDKILFKPEADPVGPNLSALRDATGGKARIFEGSGGIYLVDSFRRGIVGTIPGMDLLDGVVALWRALQAGDDAKTYRLYFPICAIIALQLQAGLDGFLAIEKYIMVRRGIFTSAECRQPTSWRLDEETRREVDRLFDLLQTELKGV